MRHYGKISRRIGQTVAWMVYCAGVVLYYFISKSVRL
jgi:hypothetical protein